MKKIFILGIGAFFIFSIWSLADQAPTNQASTKIAYVNTSVVLAKNPDAKEIKSKLEKTKNDLEKKLDASKSQLLKMQQQLSGANVTDAQKEKFVTLESSYKTKFEALQNQLEQQQMSEMKKLKDKIQKAIQIVSKQNNYDLVLDKAVIYYVNTGNSNIINITDQVLTTLQSMKSINM